MNYDYTTTINLVDNSLELTFVDDTFQELANWLATNTQAKAMQEEWQSKYNKYVVYQYKPFAEDSFNYVAKLFYKDAEQINFADFILDKEIQRRKKLDKLLLLEAN